MNNEICPWCDTEFKSINWKDGECPNCKAKYTWDSISHYASDDETAEWEEEWVIIEWGGKPIK